MKVRLLIFGGRDYADYTSFRVHLWEWMQSVGISSIEAVRENVEIVCGGCDMKGKLGIVTYARPNGGFIYGADGLAEKLASLGRVPINVFEADWKKHGRSAGPIRNSEMAKYITSDESIKAHALGFWDGKSLGSSDMINKLRRVNVVPVIINY